MKWFGAETFEEKLHRLEWEIAKYDQVVLVGESAGASVVLHVAEKNPQNVLRYVTLCGVCQASMPMAHIFKSAARCSYKLPVL